MKNSYQKGNVGVYFGLILALAILIVGGYGLVKNNKDLRAKLGWADTSPLDEGNRNSGDVVEALHNATSTSPSTSATSTKPTTSSNNKVYTTGAITFQYPKTLIVSTEANNPALIALFRTASGKAVITLRKMPAGTNLQTTLIKDVVFDGSGANPKNFSEFTKVALHGNTYYFIKTGLFEGQLGVRYYLPVGRDVYVFNLTSFGVDWTNPSLDIQKDPGHELLKNMLATLVVKR